jgi:hypothetical protein
VRASHLLEHLEQLLGADAEPVTHRQQEVLHRQEVVP